MTRLSALGVLAAVYAVVFLVAKLFDRAANVGARIWNEGSDRQPRKEPSTPDAQLLVGRAGSPFTVDARNGATKERDDSWRISALVELHRAPEGVVPPKSKSIRRTH